MSLDLKNINKKILFIFSLTGVILSFIVGIISGNNLSYLLFHGFVSGIVVGIVVFIANIMIISFLPELLESYVEKDKEDKQTGGNVDMVLSGEETSDEWSGELYNSEIADIHEDFVNRDDSLTSSKKDSGEILEGQSMEDIAKAVRTVLKKE